MATSLGLKTGELAREYADLFQKVHWVLGTGVGFLGVIFAYIVNHAAGTYATSAAGAWTSDLVFAYLPHFDTSLLHVRSSGVFGLIVFIVLFVLPRYLPIGLISVALLSLSRSLCISTTHLGIYPDAPAVHSMTTFGGDLFFSGHVAFPMLFAFVFWEIIELRVAFIACAILMGGESLVGHLHYSIDVLAAPFFAYGIYAFIRHMFPTICSDSFSDVENRGPLSREHFFSNPA